MVTTYTQRLQEITGGLAPEEGDFNTALLDADDVPNWRKEALMAELREHYPDEDPYDDPTMWDREGEEDVEEYSPLEAFTLYASCEDCEWWDWVQGIKDVDDPDTLKEEFREAHRRGCVSQKLAFSES